MMLKDFDFTGIQATRIRVLGYAKDGNTPQKHFYNAYPLEKVLNDDKYKGLWIARTFNEYFGIFNKVGEVYICYTSEYQYNHIESMKNTIDTGFINYIGIDGFIRFCANLVEHNWHMKIINILALSMNGYTDLADHYANYKAIWIYLKKREEQERHKAYLKEQEEKQRKRQEEKNRKLDEAENSLKSHKETANDDGIILDLMRKYNINVPLRTQGWILDCLATVTFTDGSVGYRYYKRKNGRGSQKAFKCLRDLMDAITAA